MAAEKIGIDRRSKKLVSEEFLVANPAEAHRRRIAESFYRAHASYGMDEIEYIDFNYPVRIVSILADTKLWGFKDSRVSPLHPHNTFFTIPGTPVESLGVSGVGNLKFNPKVLKKVLNEYLVWVEIPAALESVCKDGIDTWSQPGLSIPVKGGGIPNASRYLSYTTPFPNKA